MIGDRLTIPPSSLIGSGRAGIGRRIASAFALRGLGGDAAPAVPHFVRLLRRPDPASADGVLGVIAAIGPAAASASGFLFRSWSEAWSASAQEALSAIGPTALPAILEEVERMDDYERLDAYLSLRLIAADGLPALRAALGHSSENVRSVAVLSLVEADSETPASALEDQWTARRGTWEYDGHEYACALRDLARAGMEIPMGRLRDCMPQMGARAHGHRGLAGRTRSSEDMTRLAAIAEGDGKEYPPS